MGTEAVSGHSGVHPVTVKHANKQTMNSYSETWLLSTMCAVSDRQSSSKVLYVLYSETGTGKHTHTHTASVKHTLHALTSFSSRSSIHQQTFTLSVEWLSVRVWCNRRTDMLSLSLWSDLMQANMFLECFNTVGGFSDWLSTWLHSPISIMTELLKIPLFLHLKDRKTWEMWAHY